MHLLHSPALRVGQNPGPARAPRIMRRRLSRRLRIVCGVAAMGALSVALITSAARAGDVRWKTSNFNGVWNVAANWNTNTVPGTLDDVFNDYTNSAITFTSSDTINSFLSAGAFNLNGGTLTGGKANAASTIQVNNLFTINGGGLSNFTVNQGVGGSIVFTNSGGNSISNSLLNSNVTFGNNAFAEVFNGGNAFNGVSTFAGGNARLYDGNAVLSIGSGGSLLGYGTINQSLGGATLTNNGIIDANQNTKTLTLSPSYITGGGVFQGSNGGTLSIGGTLTGSNATVHADTGTVLVDGGGIAGTFGAATGTGFSFSGNGGNSISSAVVNGNVTFGNNAFAEVFNGGNAFNGVSTFAGGNARLYDGNAVLSIGSGGSLLGYGTINQSLGGATLTNNGTINANVSGQTLVISPSTINGSNGIFQASNGGILSIGGFLNGNNIVVNAMNGIVQIDGGGLGGSVSSSSGTGISFTGNGGNYISNAVIKGNVTFTGGFAEVYNGSNSVSGTLTMVGGNARLYDGNAVLSIGSGGSLLGYGTINQSLGGATLTNNGTINANVSGQTLVISPSTINGSNGIFQASNGGILSIGGSVVGNHAVVHADTGTVLVDSGSLNGTFDAATGTGISFSSNSGNTIGYTVAANVNGNVTFGNNAFAEVFNGGNAFNGVSTFAGGNARLYDGNAVLSIGSGGSLLGYGTINQSLGGATLTNNGTINASSNGKTLTLSPSAVTNNGTMQATNGGTLTVSPTLKNTGTVRVDSSSRINLNGGMTQTAGLTNVNGALSLNGNNLALQGGMLSGNGTITGNVQNTGGAVNPGNSPGLLTISGNYTQSAGGAFDVELGGHTAGSQYDQLVVTGIATLGGTIDVDYVNGFVPVVGDQFTVLLRGSGSGSFLTLATDDFGLRYSVQYNPTSVVVTVTAVPEPGSIALFASLGVFGAGFLARKRRAAR